MAWAEVDEDSFLVGVVTIVELHIGVKRLVTAGVATLTGSCERTFWGTDFFR